MSEPKTDDLKKAVASLQSLVDAFRDAPVERVRVVRLPEADLERHAAALQYVVNEFGEPVSRQPTIQDIQGKAAAEGELGRPRQRPPQSQFVPATSALGLRLLSIEEMGNLARPQPPEGDDAA